MATTAEGLIVNIPEKDLNLFYDLADKFGWTVTKPLEETYSLPQSLLLKSIQYTLKVAANKEETYSNDETLDFVKKEMGWK